MPQWMQTSRSLRKTGVRGAGTRMVLQILRTHKNLSRTDIGRLLHVSPATVSHWVQELVDQHLIEEGDWRTASPGRPTTYLRLRRDAAYALVADVMHDSIVIALVDFCGGIVESRKLACDMEEYQQGIASLRMALRSAVADFESYRISGVSMIFPGIWDDEKDHLVFSSSLPQWIGINLMDEFYREWDLPVYIENDANAAATGELWFGAAQEIDDALVILARFGLGSAVVRGREMLKGAGNPATGLGHMVVDVAECAPSCRCGNRGCMEAILADTMRPDRESFASDDAFAKVARILGAGAANLVNLLGLKSVIVVNQEWRELDVLWPLWVQEMRTRIMPHLLHQVRFQVSALGGNATLLGGAWKVFSESLSALEQKEAL